jgi:hypothetical protein
MQISFTVRGLEKLKAFLKDLPRGTRIVAVRAFAEYMLGNKDRGLRHEPDWKFVSRADAYGKVSDAPDGYFSWKQFRFVAAETEGFTKIPQDRTHEIANAWTVKEKDSNWTSVKIENDANGAGWVFGDNQARQPALVGWRKWRDIISTNTKGALQAAQRAVNEWLKSK